MLSWILRFSWLPATLLLLGHFSGRAFPPPLSPFRQVRCSREAKVSGGIDLWTGLEGLLAGNEAQEPARDGFASNVEHTAFTQSALDALAGLRIQSSARATRGNARGRQPVVSPSFRQAGLRADNPAQHTLHRFGQWVEAPAALHLRVRLECSGGPIEICAHGGPACTTGTQR